MASGVDCWKAVQDGTIHSPGCVFGESWVEEYLIDRIEPSDTAVKSILNSFALAERSKDA